MRTILRILTAGIALFGLSTAYGQQNESATHVENPDGTWTFRVVSRVVPGNGTAIMNLAQVHLFLATGTPGPGFDCHLIAGPAGGMMYLADDLGDWGPNERDRYISPSTTNVRQLRPAVEWDGVQTYAGDANEPNDWPNNSQCRLIEAGSKFSFSSADPGRIEVTFHVEIRANVYGQIWKSVSSYVCTPSGACVWSNFDGYGAFGAPGPPSLGSPATPMVLSTGFQSKNNQIRVGAKPFYSAQYGTFVPAGTRDVFYFRFRHTNGVQEVGYLEIAITGSNAAPTSAGQQCRVEVWVPNPSAQLYNDAGTAKLPIGQFGNPLYSNQNSQCIVYAENSRVQFLSPTDVLVRLDIEFRPGWAGTNGCGARYPISADGVQTLRILTLL